MQQVGGVGGTLAQGFDGGDNGFQCGPFPAELLGALRIVPDAGFGQFELYLGEAFLAVGVVKDTP